MLGKLFKYDIKYIIKGTVPAYVLLLIFAALTRGCKLITEYAIFGTLARFCGITTLVLMVCTAGLLIIRTWERFLGNVYGDQSYLTHTLPVTRTQVYLSKIFSAITGSVISILVILGSVMLGFYSEEIVKLLEDEFRAITVTLFDCSLTSIVIIFVLVVFMQIICIISCGFTGGIIGHRFNDKKMEISIGVGITTYYVVQIVMIGILVVTTLTSDNMLNFFKMNQIPSISFFKNLMIAMAVLYTVGVVAINVINAIVFKKGVNVD